MQPVLAIVGPTGSGKSDLGLSIAQRFGGEIISCDSVQVYSGLNIGSAKTPPPERRAIPHHLLDVVDPAEDLTAGAYARLARKASAEIVGRGALPVIVGGTGLYLRAFLEGLSPAPERDEALRRRLQTKQGTKPLVFYRFIRRYDPAAAARIHPNDHQKLIRAVELAVKGRRPATAIQQSPRDALTGVDVLKIGLWPERRLLYEKLDHRTAAMFSAGLLQETAALLAQGIDPATKALQSLGYKQAIQVLEGSLAVEAAVTECQAKTRQYAKRQFTWFRTETGISWLNGFGSETEIREQAFRLCEEFLQGFPKIP